MTRFAEILFELIPYDRTPVRSRPLLLHANILNFSKIYIEVIVFEVPHPSCYILKLSYPKYSRFQDTHRQLIFIKPNMSQELVTS